MEGGLNLCNLQSETCKDGTREIIAIAVFNRGSYVYITDRNDVYLVSSNLTENIATCNFLCQLQGSYCSMTLYSNSAAAPYVLIGTTKGLCAYPLLPRQVYSSLTAETNHIIANIEAVAGLIIYSRDIRSQGNENSNVPFLCSGKNNIKASLKLAEKNKFTLDAQENQYLGSGQDRRSRRDSSGLSNRYYEVVISKWDSNRLRYLAVIDGCVVSNGQFTVRDQDGVLVITAFALNIGAPVIYSYSEEGKPVRNFPPSYDAERLLSYSFNSIGIANLIVSTIELVYISCSHSLYVYNVYTEKLVQIPCENILQMTLTPSNNVMIMVNHGLYLACYNQNTESVTIHKLYDFGASVKPNKVAISGQSIMCCGCLMKNNPNINQSRNIYALHRYIPVTMRLVGSD